MALYSGVPPGVPPPNGGSFALVSAPGAMPPPAKGWGGLVNWHSLVLVFSYKVRPSGNCVVFHRGGAAAGGGVAPGAVNRAELPPLGGGTPATPRWLFSA